MGRSSKKGANQHNTKHENGVVAPGKRVARQKSNGQLNGPSEGKSKENPPPLPTVPSQNLTVPGEASASTANTAVPKMRPIPTPRPITVKNMFTSPPSEDLDEPESEAEDTKMKGHQHRKIDVSSIKQASTPEGGALHLAFTVLRSCPISDTLAILIFLLSLPPTFLNLTNAMFAVLTFVPPSGSFTTLPSLTDITSSFSPATPSFIVLVLIDFLAISLWYLIPFPLTQGILLDCAQATVATTLGGGYSYRPGASDNFPLMVAVVFLTHLGRYRKTTLRWLHKTRMTKYLPLVDSFDDIPPRPSYVLGPNRTWLETLKIWVAIHILFQGLTRLVRRSLHSSRGTSLFSSHSRNIDPEAVASSQGTGEGSEGSHNPPNSPSILKSKSSLQHLRDVRDKISSGKRRRKQANYVRSQQPLWAAFAATKATIMREYEQTQASRDARGSNAEGVENLGSAPFSEEEDRIWITKICSDKFYFETSELSESTGRGRARGSGQGLEDEIGTDQSRAFFVQVNGATWASVKVQEISQDQVQDQGQDHYGMGQWVGEICGLSPANTYRISWRRRGDGVELYSQVIVTSSPPVAEQSSAANSTTPQTVRPSSPASPVATLKTSISVLKTTNGDLIDLQRRTRKEYKATLNALKKELDLLTDKLARLANSDKSLQARKLQLNQSITQNEDLIASLSGEIESQAEIPEDALQEWQTQKESWEDVRNEHSRVQEDLQRTKEENRREQTALHQEAMNARQKKERLQARLTKLMDQYKRLTMTATAPETRRAHSEQPAKVNEKDHIEHTYQEMINEQQRKYNDVFTHFQANSNHIRYLEQTIEQSILAQNAHQTRSQYENRPITPEGDLPGTNPNRQAPGQSRYTPFTAPEIYTASSAMGFGAVTGAAGAAASVTNGLSRDSNGRRRSHSAVSGASIYAEAMEDDEDDLIPPEYKRKSGFGGAREGSDGRSSSSGSPHVSQVHALALKSKNTPPAGFIV